MLEIAQSNDSRVAVRRAVVMADIESLDTDHALPALGKDHRGRGSHDSKTNYDNVGRHVGSFLSAW
jgi:hypothetical protein